jgi:hypothetical protein
MDSRNLCDDDAKAIRAGLLKMTFFITGNLSPGTRVSCTIGEAWNEMSQSAGHFTFAASSGTLIAAPARRLPKKEPMAICHRLRALRKTSAPPGE